MPEEDRSVEIGGMDGGVSPIITGDRNTATITITNYYYRKNTTGVPVESTDTADENLPCPYRGLFHFGPDDAAFFFGREVFVEELFAATQTRKFIPVLGASGSGKSSVVLAGLVPKLQQVGHWKFTHFRPGEGDDPFHALALALVPLFLPHLFGDDKLKETRKIAESLRNEVYPLSYILTEIQHNYPQERVLLIADQFEELYTLCPDQKVRHHFLDTLLAYFQSSPDNTNVLVATMRADFLGNALSYPKFGEVLRNADIKIRSMNREELSQVIVKPAEKLGITFQDGLVKRILDDVEDQPGNLPLLEFALTELWNKRTGKQLTHQIYEEIGQVEGALARHADQKYSQLTDEEKEKVRRIFIQLVRPGEGVEDTRRIAMKAELGEQSWSLVKQLADARLVVTSRNAASQETVEIVHEALIRNWGELREWMNTDRVFRAWQERLRAAKGQWEATNRDSDSLLRGAALAEAQEKLKERPEDLIDEKNFIEQSIQERDRQRHRTIITFTSFSVVASVLALVAGIERWHSVISEKNDQLIVHTQSSEALFTSNKKFDALLESIRSGKQMKGEFGIKADTEMQVVGALLQAVYGVRERNRFEGYNQPFIRAAFSADGTKIAATNFDGAIKIWNFNGAEIKTINQKKSGNINNQPISLDCPANSVSFSSSSNTIVASDGDNIKLWDFNGKELKSFPGKGKDVVLTSISNDGKLIAAVSHLGKVTIWNQKGEELDTFQNYDNFLPMSIPIFSPDNNILASAGQENVILRNLNTKTSTPLKNDWTVCSVDFNSNSRELAVTELLSRVKLWSIKDQKPTFFEDLGVISVIHSSEGLVSTNWDGSIKFWHLFNNEWQVESWNGHSAPVWNASFSPNKKMLLSVSDDKTIKLWNLEGIKPPSFRPSNGSLGDISLSPDGQTIATVTADDSIKFWNLDGTPAKKTFHKVSGFSKITFSPDGKYLVSSFRSIVQLWNINSGESKILITEKLPRGKRNDFGRVSFSSDSKTIAIGREDGTIKLLHLDGTEIKTLQGGSKIVSYSKNGKIIASASSNNTVKLWNSNGKELSALIGSSYPITSLSFSPDSQTLVAGNKNGNIIIWGINGTKLQTLQGHNSAVKSLTFRPDGKIFASASGNGSNEDDGTIKFWSIDGIEIKTFKTNSPSVSGINFSRDGKMLIVGKQMEVTMWNLNLDYLLSKGCNWVRDYLENNPQVSKSDKHLCDDVPKE